MARAIAFFNQKGGTAKTTSTLNVAAALAERGRRVLAIDMDPQASLTMATGVDIAALDASVYDLLLDDSLDLPRSPCRRRCRGFPSSHRTPTSPPPSWSCSTCSSGNGSSSTDCERGELADYDYVLIDSPPALNMLSINILVAADELVIPIEPHPLSLMVLRRLFETISRVRRLNPDVARARLSADKGPPLVAPGHRHAGGAGRGVPRVRAAAGGSPLGQGAESAAERTSVLHYMPRSAIAAAYREVGAWLEEHDPHVAATTEAVSIHV